MMVSYWTSLMKNAEYLRYLIMTVMIARDLPIMLYMRLSIGESCGIVVNNNECFIHKDMGLVPEVFNDNILENLKGQSAVGHVRYSTTEGST